MRRAGVDQDQPYGRTDERVADGGFNFVVMVRRKCGGSQAS